MNEWEDGVDSKRRKTCKNGHWVLAGDATGGTTLQNFKLYYGEFEL